MGLVIGIVISFIIVAVIEVVLIAYPKSSEKNTDYIIVLGAGLKGGDKLSGTLKGRLDVTLECINKYNNDGYIVVSGGQGSDENISEAEAMKNYLVKKGIDQDRILVEDKSTSTSENFKFSKKIIEEHSSKTIEEVTVKVITTDFHAFRSSLIAKKNGYDEVEIYTDSSIIYLVPSNYIREVFALIKTVIFD